MIVVAGLPGTGKSLLIHQLAHLAVDAGHVVHLLQWDVARPVFEASAAGRRYPVRDGVTDPLIRRAVGIWARRAVSAWQRRHAAVEPLLIVEAPLVGGRLIELAQRTDDDAEPLLGAAACRFVIPVPSSAVRQFIEAERARRADRPLHEREQEDAPPAVLRVLWHELLDVARRLGVAAAGSGAMPYEPEIYRRVYERLLRHRHVETVPLDTVLAVRRSVYEFTVARADVVPTESEATDAIREAEARGLADVDGWWAL